mmetsp:Transcript_2512/g.3189  ORF Transcript_2512/g.3189 Transcript_2512/m.3189 type:complete len:283 (-) Transcript_2512:601-1449(-)|eukprot:CAMPEP_0204824338 /NCGR_PEP_ID=MMETSP1346-20131115/2364_1 /ASSEMBLY_ACC=CAM_ASM_000771 /TAXON_ID=215587 /ORGANISM="Aplanochytrium stocchinoi, Strain GSBS06" /LENGTH=282 /DNA_ID=CAMNT_0051951433 /DNA_START=267 /DNA_END=1115 /DNA_ORIENTATION=-
MEGSGVDLLWGNSSEQEFSLTGPYSGDDGAGSKRRKGGEIPKGRVDSRRKKVPKVAELEQRVNALEKENLELRLQLKVGIETAQRDAQEKWKLTRKLEEMVGQKASNEDLEKVIKMYVKKFSDYGEDRTESINKHMKQLEKLLFPTQTTKMCMWSLHQDDDFYKTDGMNDAGDGNIWSIICNVIEATEDQKEKIKLHRDDAKKMAKDLRFTIRECEDLKKRMDLKNAALHEEMKELRKILTSNQLAKFILWVNKNKATMAMLDKLWSPIDELKRGSSSSGDI